MIDKAHGIMFHHFYNEDEHIKVQGAINSEEFRKILLYLKREFNLLSAHEWLAKSISKTLNKKDICITFDDNLLCQYDIALPVLNELNIKAFWFIYSSPLVGVTEKLELYRYFRSKYFNGINNFYAEFKRILLKTEFRDFVLSGLEKFDENNYLAQFSFYSSEDKEFRFIRDELLGQQKYYELMDYMIKENNVDVNKISKLLWINSSQIEKLSNEGHIIGLHSHSHPTAIKKLSTTEQTEEYSKNFKVLNKILNTEIITMAHPNGSYSKDTLEILSEQNIKVGFRSDAQEGYESSLEYPRVDHAFLKDIVL